MGIVAEIMGRLVERLPLEQDPETDEYLRRKNIIDYAAGVNCNPVLLSVCMMELAAQQKPGEVYATFNDRAAAACILAQSLNVEERQDLIKKHHPLKELQI